MVWPLVSEIISEPIKPSKPIPEKSILVHQLPENLQTWIATVNVLIAQNTKDIQQFVIKTQNDIQLISSESIESQKKKYL